MFSKELINSIEKAKILFQKGEYKKALKISTVLLQNNSDNYFLQNMHGYILLGLNDYKASKKFFLNCIDINKNFAEAYYLLGIANTNLNDLESSLENFLTAIKLNPKLKDAHNKIISILTSFKPKNNHNHPYVFVNSMVDKINFNYNEDDFIDDFKIKNFFTKSTKIVDKYFKNLGSPDTQIFRQNSDNLNCNRHFKVFNTFNAIPEFCFGCFKIVIDLTNVLDLFKLYFVFDNLYLGLNNIRKVMIETRDNVSGTYKGLIYCKNVNEVNSIKEKLHKLLSKNIGNNFSISAKRGCTEFGIKYPQFKKISLNESEMMKYNNTWKEKEKIIDNQIYNENSEKGLVYASLKGPKLSDILIMKNWLIYAKKINDNSFKI
tara:strand:+ start:1050 stop:2177 length:1128 start_codon:yes stop_codon:yes gene_type:complete